MIIKILNPKKAVSPAQQQTVNWMVQHIGESFSLNDVLNALDTGWPALAHRLKRLRQAGAISY